MPGRGRGCCEASACPRRIARRPGSSRFPQFAKYVGNIGQHIGRVALAHRRGWQTGRVVLSLFVENGFALGAGALVVGVSVLAGLGGGDLNRRAPLVLALLVGGWAFGTWLLRRLLLTPPAFVRKLLKLNEPISLRPKLLATYLGVHLVSYAGLGFGLAICLWGVAGHFPNTPGKYRPRPRRAGSSATSYRALRRASACARRH